MKTRSLRRKGEAYWCDWPAHLWPGGPLYSQAWWLRSAVARHVRVPHHPYLAELYWGIGGILAPALRGSP